MAVIDKSNFLNGERGNTHTFRGAILRQASVFTSKESLGEYMNALASVINGYFIAQLNAPVVDLYPYGTTGYDTEPIVPMDWTYPTPVSPLSPNGNVWSFVGYQNPVITGVDGESVFTITTYGEEGGAVGFYLKWEFVIEGIERVTDGTPTGVYDVSVSFIQNFVYLPPN